MSNKFTLYKDISSISIETTLLDGIRYRMITTGNDSIVFTCAIDNHLLLYNRLVRDYLNLESSN